MQSLLRAKLKAFENNKQMPDGLIHAYQYNLDLDGFTLCKFQPDGEMVEIVDALEYAQVKYIEE